MYPCPPHDNTHIKNRRTAPLILNLDSWRWWMISWHLGRLNLGNQCPYSLNMTLSWPYNRSGISGDIKYIMTSWDSIPVSSRSYPLRYSGSKHVCERKIIGNIGVDLYLNTMQWRVMGVKTHASRLENWMNVTWCKCLGFRNTDIDTACFGHLIKTVSTGVAVKVKIFYTWHTHTHTCRHTL